VPDPEPTARRGLSLPVFWLASWLACAVLWMILDDTVAVAELGDGAVAAAIGATGATLVYAERLMVFAPRARWARALWRPLVAFGPDLVLLARVLVRALRAGGGERSAGVLYRVPFEVAGDEGEATARIALATVCGTFAPNTIVLDIDAASETMLVHQLVGRPQARASVDPLGLG